MIEKKLGKINRVKFGSGGYDDAMFGITFESMTLKSWRVLEEVL